MKLAIAGAAGRMGRVLTRIVNETPGAEVAGGIEPKGSPHVGADMGVLAGIGALDVAITDDPLSLFTQIDGIIDFTVPQATIALAELSAQARIVHVIGTTGFDAAGEALINDAAAKATIVKAGNMSLGVNLLALLTQKVAAALGEDYDIEIVEMHHRMKVDAPSGTALMLGEAAAKGRGIDLAKNSERGRDGVTGARAPGAIGFAALRGGSVAGDHDVIFATENERIELIHRAENRSIFARGALRAATWLQGQPKGRYTMDQVLGL